MGGAVTKGLVPRVHMVTAWGGNQRPTMQTQRHILSIDMADIRFINLILNAYYRAPAWLKSLVLAPVADAGLPTMGRTTP